MSVPKYEKYYLREPLNADQRTFLSHWVSRWRKGEAISVNGQIGYLFEYLISYLHEPEQVPDEVPRLLAVYGMEDEDFDWSCRKWISDYYLMKEDYEAAIKNYPRFKLGGIATHAGNGLLNIKRLVGSYVQAPELMALVGPKLTDWGRSNAPLVAEQLTTNLDSIQDSMKRSLVVDWSRGENRYGWHLFPGLAESLDRRLERPFYCYYTDNEVCMFANTETRKAEDQARERAGVPIVGEGWVAETTLFYQIKDAFPDFQVVHHAQPFWLGRQHLDIFLPEIDVAIEFQGVQHDQPIDFFGGQDQFLETQRRDATKLSRCVENQVILIYVRQGYELSQIVSQIRELADSVKDPMRNR